MDKLLAKLAEYPQIEEVADLNASNEPSPSRSEDAIQAARIQLGSARASSSGGAQRTSSSGRAPFPEMRPDESDQAFPFFKLEHPGFASEASPHARGPHEWHDSSPEKISATRGEIDAEFRNLSNSFAGPSSSQAGSSSVSHWAPADLLVECSQAVAANDSSRVQNLMWVLNELASPYGDADQRLASYFLQALFCKVTGTGARCHRILTAAAEKTYSFDSLRKMILEFQEASPWTTFGHVAGNGAIMEAFEGEMKVHIVDISGTYCTQWPTLLEALATRAEGTPHLRLTTVVISPEESALKVMKQIMTRLERFARLMGVPFESVVTQQPQLEKLELAVLDLRQDEALAVNCIQTLHHVSERVAGGEQYSPRDLILCTFRNANPKIMIIVEDEVDLVSPDFMTCFCEALRFYSLLFESLEENFPRASNERLMLERTCGRNMVNVIACDGSENLERQEKGLQWDFRLKRVGLMPAPFSDDVVDDVRALLKRYKEGWGLSIHDNRLYLTWREQLVICATAWKPIANPSPES